MAVLRLVQKQESAASNETDKLVARLEVLAAELEAAVGSAEQELERFSLLNRLEAIADETAGLLAGNRKGK